MPDLTTQQLELIASKSKGTRPTIYDSSLRCRLPISKETEDALILLGSDTKAKVGRYLYAFVGKSERASRLSDVLSTFASQQTANQTSANKELDLVFIQFNVFKKELFGSGNEVFTRGLDPLVKALNIGLGNIKRKQDRIKYGELNNTVAVAISKPDLTDDQKKELLSWVAVLVSYP